MLQPIFQLRSRAKEPEVSKPSEQGREDLRWMGEAGRDGVLQAIGYPPNGLASVAGGKGG